MTKLLRRKSSPDSEQLLTPRKNGFFGKRNNGVRSEDLEKPKQLSARRLVSSVFGGGKNKSDNTDDDDDNGLMMMPPLGESQSPAIHLQPFGDHKPHFQNSNGNKTGTPKTAPPSPDLLVTTNNVNHHPTSCNNINSNNNVNNNRSHHLHNHHYTGNHAKGATPPAGDIDEDETVMSDLTGTVSPTPPQLPPKNSNAIAAVAPSNSAAGANGTKVTFASTPTLQDSFYSAYSPSLGVFQSSSDKQLSGDNNTINQSEDGNRTNSRQGSVSPNKDYCKSTVLDQVLGVVDGACHRTMDLTLGRFGGGLTSMRSSNNKPSDSTPQWGVAPSEDEDESTCLDTNTMGDTMGGTLTQTTTDYISRDTRTQDTRTQDTRTQETKTSSTMASTTAKDQAAVRGGIATNSNKNYYSTLTKTTANTKTDQLAANMKLQRESSELHENFELVLGHRALSSYRGEGEPTDAENNASSNNTKKRGWGSRILNKNNGIISDNNKNEPLEEEKKDDWFDQNAVQTKMELFNLQGKPPPTPVKAKRPTTTFASPVVAKQGAIPKSPTSATGGVHNDTTGSPSGDVGVEIQSRRIVKQQQLEEKLLASTASSSGKPPQSPSSKGLSSLVKRLRFGGKVRRSKSTSAIPRKRSASPIKRVFNNNSNSSGPSAHVRAASVSLPGKEPQTNEATRAPSPSKLETPPPKNVPKPFKCTAAEEEKTEIEPPLLDTSMETTDTPGHNNAVPNESSKVGGTTLMTTNEVAAAAAVASVAKINHHPEITRLSSQPIPIKDRSNSFKLPPSNEPTGAKDNDANELLGSGEKLGENKLENPVELNRLRSAPVKLSSSEALAQKEQKEEEKQEAKQGDKSKEPEEEKSSKEHQDKTGSRKKTPPKLTWKSAVDDQGRTYYYHRATRKTTWVKPPEFDAEQAAVKKYKEEMEAARKEASETQQVIDGCKNVEAIQASLRKKTQRDFDPKVWQIKQEILDIVKTMPLPKGTNIEKLLIQYDGREEQLLSNLRDLVESKPFDEPFQVPKKETPPPSSSHSEQNPVEESNLNISHASSSISSSAHLHAVDVQQRVRTAVSANTRISEKTYLTEKTEKIRNTSGSPTQKGGIDTIREKGASGISTGSISSASSSLPPRHESFPLHSNPRVPSKIPAVPRTRDLKIEEFTNNRIAKETFNGDGVVTSPKRVNQGDRASPKVNEGAKAVAEQIVALSSLDDDGSSYHGDYDDTVDDRGNDTASEKNADSISALSETDADYQAQKENFERARRRALDVAVEREDWDLAAALSEGMKQVKESLYGKDAQREWTQTELDRFISENDWDAVSKYIAHMRDHSVPSSSTAGAAAAAATHSLPSLSAPPRGRDPGTGRDPEGFTPPKRITSAAPVDIPPAYVSEATKRASTHTQSARRLQQQQQQQLQQVSATGSVTSSQGSSKPAQTRFGARSQLQHSDLTSISSWDNSSSSYDSEYSDNSYESEDEQGYISLRVRRNEFEC